MMLAKAVSTMRIERDTFGNGIGSCKRLSNESAQLPERSPRGCNQPALAAVYSHAAELQNSAALTNATEMRTAQKRTGMSFAEGGEWT